VAAPVSRVRFKFPAGIVVGLTILTSAILYAWMRVSVADGIRAPGQTVALGRFGAAVPLAAVGLVASLWRPLALRRTAWAADDSRSIGTASDAVSAQPKPRPRPWLALTAVSVGILTLAALANAYDPLPAQIGTTIPTYLGLRERAMDVRTRTDLRGAIGTMDGYRARTGTYAGFVAAQGRAAMPAIAWVDGTPQGVDVVGLTQAGDDMAEVVALSGSGAAFCVRSLVTPAGTTVTYGTGTDASAARADCASNPWTDAATSFPPFAALCDDVDDQTIFVCRNVQYLLRKTIGAPAAG
jgi:hypothetical protein